MCVWQRPQRSSRLSSLGALELVGELLVVDEAGELEDQLIADGDAGAVHGAIIRSCSTREARTRTCARPCRGVACGACGLGPHSFRACCEDAHALRARGLFALPGGRCAEEVPR